MENTIGIWSLEDAKKYHIHSLGLAQWLVNNLSNERIINDFGCGPGFYIKYLQDAGRTCFGYEGTENINDIAYTKNILVADITLPIDAYKGHVLCLEVMEHISPEKEDSTLENIQNACVGTLVLSWGVPGQPGHGHINCRNTSYVIPKLLSYGFACDFVATMEARKAAISTPHTSFFNDTLYVFKKI